MKTRIHATHSPPAAAFATTAVGAKSAKFLTGRQTNADQCTAISATSDVGLGARC